MLKANLIRIILLSAVLTISCASVDDRGYTVVMMGDSTTLSARSAEGDKLTDCVQAHFDSLYKKEGKVSIVNAGKGGDTAKGALSRLQSDVLERDPEVVSLSFGLNDTARASAEYRESLEKLILAIQRNSQAKILLITSTPFDNNRHVWKDKYEEGLDEYMDKAICQHTRDLSEKYAIPLCDLHRTFSAAFEKDPELENRTIRPDGVHLTEAGNRMAAKHIVPQLYKVLTGKPLRSN